MAPTRPPRRLLIAELMRYDRLVSSYTTRAAMVLSGAEFPFFGADQDLFLVDKCLENSKPITGMS